MPRPRKSEAELKHPREQNGKDKGVNPEVSHGQQREVTIPHADGEWHPTAKKMYASFRTSGQVDFWQNSDWAYAWFLMGELSSYLSTKKSAMMLDSIMRGLERLMVTETDRRKARIELQRAVEPQVEAEIIAIDEYRAELGLVS
jgi:hypothetical protein